MTRPGYIDFSILHEVMHTLLAAVVGAGMDGAAVRAVLDDLHGVVRLAAIERAGIADDLVAAAIEAADDARLGRGGLAAVVRARVDGAPVGAVLDDLGAVRFAAIERVRIARDLVAAA